MGTRANGLVKAVVEATFDEAERILKTLKPEILSTLGHQGEAITLQVKRGETDSSPRRENHVITESYREEMRTLGADGTIGHLTQSAVYTRPSPQHPDNTQHSNPPESGTDVASEFLVDKNAQSRTNISEYVRRQSSAESIPITRTFSNEWRQGSQFKKDEKHSGPMRKTSSNRSKSQSVTIKVVRSDEEQGTQQPIHDSHQGQRQTRRNGAPDTMKDKGADGDEKKEEGVSPVSEYIEEGLKEQESSDNTFATREEISVNEAQTGSTEPKASHVHEHLQKDNAEEERSAEEVSRVRALEMASQSQASVHSEYIQKNLQTKEDKEGDDVDILPKPLESQVPDQNPDADESESNSAEDDSDEQLSIRHGDEIPCSASALPRVQENLQERGKKEGNDADILPKPLATDESEGIHEYERDTKAEEASIQGPQPLVSEASVVSEYIQENLQVQKEDRTGECGGEEEEDAETPTPVASQVTAPTQSMDDHLREEDGKRRDSEEEEKVEAAQSSSSVYVVEYMKDEECQKAMECGSEEWEQRTSGRIGRKETLEILKNLQDYSREYQRVFGRVSSSELNLSQEQRAILSAREDGRMEESQSFCSAKEIYGSQYESEDYEFVTYDFKISLSPEGPRVMSSATTPHHQDTIAASIEITPDAVLVNNNKVWGA